MNGSIVSISMLIELFGWISIPWENFDGGSGSSRSLSPVTKMLFIIMRQHTSLAATTLIIFDHFNLQPPVTEPTLEMIQYIYYAAISDCYLIRNSGS
jgi:hypothetical protein